MDSEEPEELLTTLAQQRADLARLAELRAELQQAESEQARTKSSADAQRRLRLGITAFDWEGLLADQEAHVQAAQGAAVERALDDQAIKQVVRDRALNTDELRERGRERIAEARAATDARWLELQGLFLRPRPLLVSAAEKLRYGLRAVLRRPVWLVVGTLLWAAVALPGAVLVDRYISIPIGLITVSVLQGLGLNVWTTAARAVRRVGEARRDYAAMRDAIDAEVVIPTMRQVLNELLHPEFSAQVHLADTSGLEDLFDAQYEVPTRSGEQLAGALQHLKAGSLGLFGPRGAGKSTLIEAARDGRLEWRRGAVIGVTVPAPVRYEAREFVPFLFGQLCLAVINQHGDAARRRDARARRDMTASRVAAGLLIVSSVVFLLYSIIGVSTVGWYSAAGGYAAGGAVTIFMATWFRGRATRLHDDPLLAVAHRDLDDLRYLETRTSEWSGEISGKAAKVGRRLAATMTGQALTLPEVTARYREFMKTALASGLVVVVGIDELDKMASADEAARFLNDVKALFGQPGVYYLVSLSEDAAASFEQRGIGIRDVFESVFDQVVRVEPLLRVESETMLRRRIIGMEPPFAEVCHMVSGGLPRELIRCAREAALIAADVDGVAVMTHRLLIARGKARERALQSVAARHIGQDGTQPALTWLRALVPEPDAAELLSRCRIAPVILEMRAGDDHATEVEEAVIGLAAWWYHAATVLEFVEGLDDGKLQLARDEGDKGSGPSAIDLLARGYLDLSVAPGLAWETVSEFRQRVGLQPEPYPLVGLPRLSVEVAGTEPSVRRRRVS